MAKHQEVQEMLVRVQEQIAKVLGAVNKMHTACSITATRRRTVTQSTPLFIGGVPSSVDSPSATASTPPALDSLLDVEAAARAAESRAVARGARRTSDVGSSGLEKRSTLQREMAYAERAAAFQAKLITPVQTAIATAIGIFEEAPEEARATALGLLLNLANVFLYMTNYNLVIPFVGRFCNHLDVPESVGGVIIGCADIMAIVVSVGYSIWTNYSFRQPLIFASATCLFGNLLVTLSYDIGGLPMLLAGRLLTGTGAARALNRRYIADFVSLEGRTTASIGFVAASAAGMAMGPFAAVPLTSAMQGWGDSVHAFGLTWNAITVSGWLMVIIWLAFWILAFLVFEEPLVSKATDMQPASGFVADGDVTEPLLSREEPRLPNGNQEATPTADHDRTDSSRDAKSTPWGSELCGSGAVAIKMPSAAEALPASVDEITDEDKGIEEARSTLGALPDRTPGPVLAEQASDTIWRKIADDPYLLPTVACTIFLFLLKLLQQGAVSSVPLLTEDFYGWSESSVGLFMAAMSLAMLPVNFSVAALTASVSDRVMMGVSVLFCMIGSLCIVSYSNEPVDLVSYLFGFSLVLAFTNILEGVSMSVLSKVIHPVLSKGTFNAGLLSTQSGSLGRLVGNFSISVFGTLVVGTVGLVNLMFLSFAAVALLCGLLFVVSYPKLQPK